MAEVVAFDPRAERQRAVRRIFGRTIRHARKDSDLAGFALVTWDSRGECNSGFYTATGPVGQSLMPAFVHDALNRHVAVALAEENESERIDGGA